MTVAMVEPHAEDTTLARWVGIAQAAAGLADRIAATEFVPEAMRGKPDVITAAIMYGDELGVGPMQALAGINVIKGKPSPSSELMRALVFRAGHSMRVLKSDGQVCRVAGKRRDDSEATVIEWNLDMARAAGLLDNNPTWRRYPRAMLLARASSELCRVMFPDVVKGLAHVVDDDAAGESFDEWAAQATGTLPEPPRNVTTIARRRDDDPVHPSGEPRPVVDTPLPEVVPPTAMGEPERLDEWPAGIDQPPLPLAPPDTPSAQTEPPDIPSPTESAPTFAPVGSGGSPALPDGDDNEGIRESEPVGRRTLAVMHMLFNDIGVSKDERDTRLAMTSRIVGRKISTSNELTRRDALDVVRILNDAAVGLVRFEADPNEPFGVAIVPTPTGEPPNADSP